MLAFGLIAPATSLAGLSAMQVATYIKQGFTSQTRAKLKLLQSEYPGMRLASVAVSCAPSGSNAYTYSCLIKYSTSYKVYVFHYNIWADAHSNGAWSTNPPATLTGTTIR